MCSCTVSCSWDLKCRKAASFRKLHVFVNVLFSTSISLIIGECCCMTWLEFILMSTLIGIIVLTDFTTVLFLFVGFFPFHFRMGISVAVSAFMLATTVMDFLLLTYETCCLLSEVAFVQCASLCESLFSEKFFEYLWSTLLDLMCIVGLWHRCILLENPFYMSMDKCSQLDFSPCF